MRGLPPHRHCPVTAQWLHEEFCRVYLAIAFYKKYKLLCCEEKGHLPIILNYSIDNIMKTNMKQKRKERNTSKYVISRNRIRLKKKNSMSQSLWQIGEPDLNEGFFFFSSSSFFFSEQLTFQIWVGHNFVQYEIWNLIFGWTRYKTEHRVEEVCCPNVLLCLSCLFIYILTSKFIKKLKKKNNQAKKIKSLNFAASNAHRKTNMHDSFETYNLFFLA